MAASTNPSSRWVSSYADKTDEWVLQRLEYLEGKERISRSGSTSRRLEIRGLRVERDQRKKVLQAAADAGPNPAAPPLAQPVAELAPATR